MPTNAHCKGIGAFFRFACRPGQAAVAVFAAMLVLTASVASGFAKPLGAHMGKPKMAAHLKRHTTKKAYKGKRATARGLRTQRKIARSRRAKAQLAARNAAKRIAPTRAAILVDAATGEVLSETGADRRAYPASLAKMMTLYVTFEELNKHRLGLDQRLPVSADAAGREPSKLWLRSGDAVRVRDLIRALVTKSANDAATVLAEGIAGSEAAFARRMTATARRLGMNDTVFRNASGLPDSKQHTTARDLARLALALYQDFPRDYAYFATEEFDFRGATIKGHNRLLATYEGADGLKTGFTQASGFNLAASAARDGRRLVGIVLGSPSWRERDRQMAGLLDRGFAALRPTETAIAASDPILPSPEAEERRAKIAKAGTRLAAMLSIAAKADPSPNPRLPLRSPAEVGSKKPAGRGPLSVQIGAFRGRQAARKLARSAGSLRLTKGREVRVAGPLQGEKAGLYKVQIVGFTKEAAAEACAILKKKMACMVVPAGGARGH